MNISKDFNVVSIPDTLFLDHTISISAKFLLIVIWEERKERCDFKHLSQVINRSEKTTKKYFNELMDAGYIKRVKDGYEVRFEKA